MKEVYYGIIEASYPPDSPQNQNKNEYEYTVSIEYENASVVPVEHVVRSDEFGAFDDHNSVTLLTGQRVIVLCPRARIMSAIIIGAIRCYSKPMDSSKGHYWLRRFNQIENEITEGGKWKLRSDNGPFMELWRKRIILDNSLGESITLDGDSNTLQINARSLNIVVNGNAVMTASGNTTINAAEANINATGNANIKCKIAKIDADKAEICGAEGEVITTKTQPTCYVTGIPFVGSKKVKAGG
jgi:hypothetical protein